jgi:phage terminase large subunit-like protein
MDKDGGIDVDVRFWMPRDRVVPLEQRDGVPYAAWVKDGWITPTDGDWRDDQAILDDLYTICGDRGINEVMFDPHGFGYIGSTLAGMGIVTARVSQIFSELGAPTEHLENAIEKKSVSHLGNPLMRWMVSSASVDTNRDGARKPSRWGAMKHKKHIDGVSALVTGLARLLRMDSQDGDWTWGSV